LHGCNLKNKAGVAVHVLEPTMPCRGGFQTYQSVQSLQASRHISTTARTGEP
jgi:hypothetical protein